MSLRSQIRCLILVLGFACPVHASERAWLLRLEGATTNYSEETFSSYSVAYDRFVLDGGNGLGVATELLLSERLGLELSFGRVGLNAHWERFEYRPDPLNPTVPVAVQTDSDSGNFTLQPLAFSVYWHPFHSQRFDLYVGPQLAWVDYDVGLHGPPDRSAEWALGGKIGAEVRLGHSPWSAGVAFRYLDIQHEGEERDQYTGIGLPLASAVLTYRIGSREP